MIHQAEERQQRREDQQSGAAAQQEALDLQVQQNALSGQADLTPQILSQSKQENAAEGGSSDSRTAADERSLPEAGKGDKGAGGDDVIISGAGQEGQPKYDSIDPMGQKQTKNTGWLALELLYYLTKFNTC